MKRRGGREEQPGNFFEILSQFRELWIHLLPVGIQIKWRAARGGVNGFILPIQFSRCIKTLRLVTYENHTIESQLYVFFLVSLKTVQNILSTQGDYEF